LVGTSSGRWRFGHRALELGVGAARPIYTTTDGEVQIPAPIVFDRQLVRARRDRAAAGIGAVDFLIQEVALRLVERVEDVRRRFPLALELGCHTGQLGTALDGSPAIGRLVQTDLSPRMVARARGLRLVADEEALPFGADLFDLALSCFSLHWANDLPGALVQIRETLKPDGLLLAALPGGTTLLELREALLQAEAERTGGAAARISPFLDVRDAGMLLQRAGFAMPVVDVDTITVSYEHPLRLLDELRAMGEANALAERGHRPLGRATLLRAAELYAARFSDARGRVPATFQILMLTAWKPHESQPQPKRRGSGQVNLARALGVPVEVLDGRRRPE
jgi:NADH dehydrogenase [ubiquinone] 1 alpha subcomplex assembly factor 5